MCSATSVNLYLSSSSVYTQAVSDIRAVFGRGPFTRRGRRSRKRGGREKGRNDDAGRGYKERAKKRERESERSDGVDK